MKHGIGGVAKAVGEGITGEYEGGFRTIPIPRNLEGETDANKRAFQQAQWDTFSPGKQEYLRREYESDIRPGAGIPGIGPLIGAAWDTDIGQSIGGSIGDWGSKLNIEQQEIYGC